MTGVIYARYFSDNQREETIGDSCGHVKYLRKGMTFKLLVRTWSVFWAILSSVVTSLSRILRSIYTEVL